MTLSFVILTCANLLAVALLLTTDRHARRAIEHAQADAAAARAERDTDGYQTLVGHRVIANLVDGGAIRGILTHVYRDALVLEHPEWVSGSRPASIGGEVTIDRHRVPILQRFADHADGS